MHYKGIQGEVGLNGSKGQKGEPGEQGPQGINVSFDMYLMYYVHTRCMVITRAEMNIKNYVPYTYKFSRDVNLAIFVDNLSFYKI